MKLQYDDPTSVNYDGKKANHRAPIVRISSIHAIEGADRIEAVFVDGYDEFSFVSQKGTFTPGDLAVFIQPDSIVPATDNFSYLWADYAAKYPGQPIPASQRRVTVRRFKKVWSEGLLVPINEFSDPITGKLPEGFLAVGHDASEQIGITHYDADTVVGSPEAPSNEFVPKRKRRCPRTLRGWLKMAWHYFTLNEKFLEGPEVQLPIYDVENFKNYSRTFVDGEHVHVTEKIHGSSARFVCIDGVLYAGSRKQWVNTKGDSYPAQALRNNPWIETWCRRNEGFALYGEVTPRQKGFDYGSTTPKFWLFDVRNPAGQWLDADDIMYLTLPQNIDTVPLLYHGGYEKAIIDLLVDGSTTVKGASHIREGIVIKTTKTDYRRGVGRAQLKIVSNAFLDRDGKLTKE